jgi:SAM-dependent methyltransferase
MRLNWAVFFAATCCNLFLWGDESNERVFSQIYERGKWGRDGLGNAISGPGSTLPQGKPFIDYIQTFLSAYEIDSVVDLGCGDWVLARNIDWGSLHYLGIDVVRRIVRNNQAKYGTSRINFIQLDGANASLPAADLFICKDVLQHLPLAQIFHILNESKKFKYSIFVNDVQESETVNQEIASGEYRPVDLTKSPFNLVPADTQHYVIDRYLKQILLIQN